MSQQTVVVLGASPKPERYSNMAVEQLRDKGHHVVPVHPLSKAIHDVPCVAKLEQAPRAPDTLTLYVGPERLAAMEAEILALAPKRIIMNPGAESDALEAKAREQGIEVVRGCTLVMLRTAQF